MSEAAQALVGFVERQPLGIRVGATTADFRQVFVGDAQIAPVRQVIEHGGGGGILLTVWQLLDLLDSVAKQFGHGATITICRRISSPHPNPFPSRFPHRPIGSHL